MADLASNCRRCALAQCLGPVVPSDDRSIRSSMLMFSSVIVAHLLYLLAAWAGDGLSCSSPAGDTERLQPLRFRGCGPSDLSDLSDLRELKPGRSKNHHLLLARGHLVKPPDEGIAVKNHVLGRVDARGPASIGNVWKLGQTTPASLCSLVTLELICEH